jgi:Homeodomain-like domain
MRKISEVLRLKHELGLSERAIAASCGVVRSTVQEVLKRCREAGIAWPLPPDTDEAALYERLYPAAPRAVAMPLPDFAAMEAELARKGVTLLLL